MLLVGLGVKTLCVFRSNAVGQQENHLSPLLQFDRSMAMGVVIPEVFHQGCEGW